MKDCPYCARKFLEKVAERHIKHCETSKSRPKPPPTKDELNEKQVKRRQLHLNIGKQINTLT
jgi:predicted anti-sigma-YlaC factor YlaD